MHEIYKRIELREDAEIIARTLQDQAELFNILIQRYEPSVYAWVTRIVGDKEEVEDIVQETFLNAWQRLDTLRDYERFPAWLRSIAINNARMWHRRQYVQLTLIDSLNKIDQEEAVFFSHSEEEWKMKVALRTAIELLTPAHREVVEHHYFKGHSYAEIAGLLAISIDTVRSRLQKARARIKREIGTMSEKAMTQNSLVLNRNDLQMLRSAAEVRRKDDHYFPAIQGVLITEAGEIVATDAHMLLVRSSEESGFRGNRVLLGGCRAEMIPDVDHAVLHLGLSEALLQVDGRDEIAFSLLNETFPEYWKVIPQSFNTVVSVKQRVLLEQLDKLQLSEEDETPMIQLILDKNEESLQLAYEVDGEEGQVMTVPLQILQAYEEKIVWGLNVNANYFRKLITGLGIQNEKEITLAIGFNGSLESIVIYDVSNPKQQGVLAPIRRK